MKVYEGTAFAAYKTGASILPVYAHGLSRSCFSRIGDHPKSTLFPKTSITFHPLKTIEVEDELSAKEKRRQAGTQLQSIMQECQFNSANIQTLFEELLETTKQYGAKRQFAEDIKKSQYSYKELIKMSVSLGHLFDRFTRRNEVVGVCMPNLLATAAMVFGLSARGRIPALINYKAGAKSIQAACDAGKIQKIITSKAFLEQAGISADILALQKVQILYLEEIRERIDAIDKLCILFRLIFPRSFILQKNADKPAVVLFTSGSESTPKGVVLSHRQLLSNIAQLKSIIDIGHRDKVLNALPMFHSFGLTGGTLFPIFAGAKLFIYPNPLHYRIVPEISYDRDCTILFGTSTFLLNYGKHAHQYDFYKMRYVVAGAEKLSETTRELWFDKFGIRIFEGYGATETSPVLAVNTPLFFKRGSVGKFLPGIEYRLTPVEGVLGGRLEVRGPNIMSGYLLLANPGVLQPPPDGWYDTGDIVDVDEDGFVHICGRVKRFAKISREMVSLETVELIANKASPLETHAAVNRPDAQKGEAIVLFTTDKNMNREKFHAKLKELGLSELSIPRSFICAEKIPLLGTGKTDYVKLKEMAYAG